MAVLGRSVLRRARQAQWARAICGGIGVAALALALAIERGASLGNGEALGLAALLGLLAVGAWVRSETVESRDVLQRVDQRLHLAGAFLAAHESCARTPESPVAQLGAARLLQRIRPGQAIEAAVPHTLGFVVLPLIGLLVLVQTVQSRDGRRELAGRRNVEVGTVADQIGDIADSGAETLTEEQRAELAEVEQKAREAAQQAADESLDSLEERAAAIEDWRQEMRKIADELEALAREAPSGSKVADDLSEASAAAAALAMDASSPDVPTPGDSTGPEGLAGQGAQQGAVAGEAEGGGSGSPTDSSSDSSTDSFSGEVGVGEPAMAAWEDSGPPGDAPLSQAAEPRGEGIEPAPGTVPPSRTVARPSEEGAGSGLPGQIAGAVPPSEGLPGESAAPSDRFESGEERPRAAEEVLPVRPWWSGRDDAIVRAWLARQ
ncbi:hypothetical protein Poly30_42770 [Planctomycetes bacterium Poly30]|uniref:Uncharacterized protein n=2 Tax=Saltatorellus ferox TaxID=2528018 RepID=A0A518EX99_9BACT|nr:hypothetical protein Poly30_42770 [Planctomycetes bacterium Poly30]